MNEQKTLQEGKTKMKSLIRNERENVTRKILLVFSSLFVIALFQSAMADYIYIDDGGSHLINDTIYQNSNVYLDSQVVNNPGTHFQIVDNGNVEYFGAHNNSTIAVDGGLISYGISAHNNSKIEVNAGTIGRIWADNHSIITINGGTFNTATFNNHTLDGFISAAGDSTTEIRGGTFSSLFDFTAWGSGTIYLYGSDFSVDGVALNYGDSLRDYGVIGGANLANLTGVIMGTLLDGSTLNCEFFLPLDNPGGADIIVVPEPLTGILIAMGALFIRRKR